MRIIDPILQELEQEAATTRKLLERVPGDKLSWKPHEKSMTLGELAMHVAAVPGSLAEIVSKSQLDVAEFTRPRAAKTADELLPALEASIANAKKILDGMDDQTVMATWKLTQGDKELMAAPRIGVVRSFLLNHWVHHRGQLSVYLRLLDVPVPSIYGPSADQNPFA